jgi:hypothetical protein
MTARTIEILPAQRLIEIVEAERIRTVEVPGRVVEIVEVGRLVVNMSGTSTQQHTQVAPAATWIIAHALGRRPAVSIYLSTGEAVETDVIATDTTVNITFPSPFSGWAILN